MNAEVTRVHEAGHWLIAERLGLPVTAVRVSVDGDSGYTEVDITEASDSQLAMLAAAGAAAEIAVFGEIRNHTGLVSDLAAYTWESVQHFRQVARAVSGMIDPRDLRRLYVLL